MTPAITGLIFAGLAELRPKQMLAVDHHMTRFVVAVLVAGGLALGGTNTPDPKAKTHATSHAAGELGWAV